MHLAEGLVVAERFRLGTMLGRGGMGSVWRATHLGLDVPCAVKFIEGELALLPEAHARFEREAKAAAQLRSPHVVQILDHGVWQGTPYIAMELLEGEDLGKRLARVRRLAPQDLHRIMSQVCRALTKAHAQGIVHRDLKPDNIFLVQDDDREIAKVLDFGIAKSRSLDLAGSSNTKTGAMLGTPYYMSPEQAQGTRQVDFRTDLWALAVISFQALTGRLPFESEALGDLLVKIIVSPLPLPSHYAPVTPGFDHWWLKAAARDPAERFQSAKDFSDSLAVACGVSQVSGVMNVPVAAAPMAAAVGVPLPAAVVSGGVGTASPMSRTVAGPTTTSGRRSAMVAGVAAALLVTAALAGVAVWKIGRPGAPSVSASAGAETARPAANAPPPPVSVSPTAEVVRLGTVVPSVPPPPQEVPSPQQTASSTEANNPPIAPAATAPAAVAVPAHKGPAVGPAVTTRPSAPVASATSKPAAPPAPKPTFNPGF